MQPPWSRNTKRRMVLLHYRVSELELESSLLFKILSLYFPFVSLEGAGITGYISYSSIRSYALTRCMGLVFVFFT